jgi:anti-anti-sigma factor
LKHTFDVDIDSADHGFVVRVTGELDLATAPTLQQELDAVFRDMASWRSLVIDLEALTFMDAHGASVLVRARKLALACGTKLTIAGVQGEPALVLKATGLDKFLKLDTAKTHGQHAGEREAPRSSTR